MKNTIKTLFGACGILLAALTFSVACSESDNSFSNSGDSSSQGGSMARFTIYGDYLYTVDDRQLRVVSLADPAKPVSVDEILLTSGDIETIFTMDEMLFIGSRSAMYIYDISRPEFPKQLSMTSHFRSCDPVVAHDTLAFVTLNSSLGSWCGTVGNVLQAYDITDVKNPELVSEVRLSSPRGLAVDGGEGIVFVCDNILKAYDISDPRDIEGMYTSASVPEVGRIDAYDCIALDGRLLVIGEDGLYQLGYDREKFTFISKIDLR